MMIKQIDKIIFPVPARVRANAYSGLLMAFEYKRGGTPVGWGIARKLKRGGLVDLDFVRRVSLYFPRHANEKLGKNWDKPSNGKIAWHLWGGDEGWEWSRQIMEDFSSGEKLDYALLVKALDACGVRL